MKILHTSDWHVGKTIRGISRVDEHRAVLNEIVDIAAAEEVDVVLLAGDLFETATPTGEHEAVVYEALLGLVRAGADVVVVAGNHDNDRRLDAVAPVFAANRVHVVATPRSPSDGGVVELTGRSDGARVRVAALPFVSKRGIVRADQLMDLAGFENLQLYAERLTRVVDALCGERPADAVNVACIHAFVAGGVLGGGERSAHTILDYALPPAAFPNDLHYVAAGHLHRHQELGTAGPGRYCGSPLQLDFGDSEDDKGVVLVTAEPGKPAAVEFRPLRSGRRLRTVKGTMDHLRALADQVGDAWLRVRVDEAPRTGLADEVRDLLPNAVDVMTTRRVETDRPEEPSRAGASPEELFDLYLRAAGHDDRPVRDLFSELHAEVLEGAER